MSEQPLFREGDRVLSVAGARRGMLGTVVRVLHPYDGYGDGHFRVQFDGVNYITGKNGKNLRLAHPEHLSMDEGL